MNRKRRSALQTPQPSCQVLATLALHHDENFDFSLTRKKNGNSSPLSFFTLLHRGQALAVGPEPGLLRVELEELGSGVGLVGCSFFFRFSLGVRVFSRRAAKRGRRGDFRRLLLSLSASSLAFASHEIATGPTEAVRDRARREGMGRRERNTERVFFFVQLPPPPPSLSLRELFLFLFLSLPAHLRSALGPRATWRASRCPLRGPRGRTFVSFQDSRREGKMRERGVSRVSEKERKVIEREREFFFPPSFRFLRVKVNSSSSPPPGPLSIRISC